MYDKFFTSRTCSGGEAGLQEAGEQLDVSTNDVVLVNTAPVARERDARDATLTGGGGLAKSGKRVEGNSLALTSAREFIATAEWALPIRECLTAAAFSVTKKGLVGEALGPVPVKGLVGACLLYTSPSPRDISGSRMPSCA